MAKIEAPYTCDICHKQKQPKSDWLIGVNDATLSMTFQGAEKVCTINAGIVLLPWANSIADRPDAAHLCQRDCAEKWTSKQIAKLIAHEVVEHPEIADAKKI